MGLSVSSALAAPNPSAAEVLHHVYHGGHELHASYRAMAIANGVSPSDPILAPCRSRQNGELL